MESKKFEINPLYILECFRENKHGIFLGKFVIPPNLRKTYVLYGRVSRTKGLRRQLAGISCIFFTFYTRKYTKNLLNYEKFLNLQSNIFCDNLPNSLYFFIKSTKPTSDGFQCQDKLCFVIFYSKNLTKIHFFKHQSQLRHMSHTGGADFSSWLIPFSLRQQTSLRIKPPSKKLLKLLNWVLLNLRIVQYSHGDASQSFRIGEL